MKHISLTLCQQSKSRLGIKGTGLGFVALATLWPSSAHAQLFNVSADVYIGYDWSVGRGTDRQDGQRLEHHGAGLPYILNGIAFPGGPIPEFPTASWGATPKWYTRGFVDQDDRSMSGWGDATASLSPIFCSGYIDVYCESTTDVHFNQSVSGVSISMNAALGGSVALQRASGTGWDTIMQVSGDQSAQRYLDMSGNYRILGKASVHTTDHQVSRSYSYALMIPEPSTLLAFGLPLALLSRRRRT